jgi:DNA repair exonuclease SbcCD ATPase subunit
MTEDLSKLKLDIGLLQKDLQMTDKLWQKVSESIEKIQEINSNLVKMISLHEQKHEQHDIAERDLKEDVKEIHSRITTVNRELTDRMNEVETHLAKKIDELKAELIDQNIKKELNENKTFKEFDKYKWMLVGAALGFGWVIGNVNLNTLATIFK